MNARSRGRLGLSLGLFYIRKTTALAGAARGVGSQGQARETSSTSHTTVDPHSDPCGSGRRCALGLYNTLDLSHLAS